MRGYPNSDQRKGGGVKGGGWRLAKFDKCWEVSRNADLGDGPIIPKSYGSLKWMVPMWLQANLHTEFEEFCFVYLFLSRTVSYLMWYFKSQTKRLSSDSKTWLLPFIFWWSSLPAVAQNLLGSNYGGTMPEEDTHERVSERPSADSKIAFPPESPLSPVIGLPSLFRHSL